MILGGLSSLVCNRCKLFAGQAHQSVRPSKVSCNFMSIYHTDVCQSLVRSLVRYWLHQRWDIWLVFQSMPPRFDTPMLSNGFWSDFQLDQGFQLKPKDLEV